MVALRAQLSVFIVLAQSGEFAVLPFKKGLFAKNEYEVAFANGMLTKSKFDYPSEILGAVSIIPETLKAVVSIPAEIIKLRVDYSTNDQALLDLKKTKIETQLEIDKLMLSLAVTTDESDIIEETPPISDIAADG